MPHLIRLLLFSLLATLVGCASVPSPQQRQESAEELARQHDWRPIKISAGQFTLVAYVPRNVPHTKLLTIYMEGDGLAWISRSQPSTDPTPIHPVGLQLALRQPRGVAVYLARPCQYVEGQDARNCSIAYWTDRRFAPEVIESNDKAVEQLKTMFDANVVELVGYSGGGAVAALVAARRKDVKRLVTVAGNLDHPAWTRLHHATPLNNSLNPADAWTTLMNVPQRHWVGGRDENVSLRVTESYLARFPEDHQPLMQVIDDFDHACCWVEHWPDLYNK